MPLKDMKKIMDKYIISKNDLLIFLRYEILYKWKQSTSPEDFGLYLLNDTPYQPDHEFIQSLCKNNEERKNPVKTGIYNSVLPADLARYQADRLYTPYKGK